MKISASILACNSAYIGENVMKAEAANVDIIHIDVTDGHYVKNITFGPQIVRDLKEITSIPLDVHLAVENMNEMIHLFAEAGPDIITIQFDACNHPIRELNTIKKYGIKTGIAINPTIDVSCLKYVLKHIDYVDLMAVEPGFGGQVFEECTYEKISTLKQLISKEDHEIFIEVDGGVSSSNAAKLRHAGADILIAGSSIFANGDISTNVIELREKTMLSTI